MLSRTWVKAQGLSIAKRFSVSPWSGDFGSTSTQRVSGARSVSGIASMGAAQASMEQNAGKLPRKNAVSTTTPLSTPGTPSRTMAQS